MIMHDSPKKKAIILCIIFAVIYVIHGMGGPAFFLFNATKTGTMLSDSVIAQYFIGTAIIVALAYLPLAIGIHRLAKKARMKTLKIISLVAIIGLAVYLAVIALALPLILRII